MKLATPLGCLMLSLAVGSQAVQGAEPAPAIARVGLTPNRAFEINGEPFFPLMAWLQDAKNFPSVRQCGMNTTAGYWTGSSGTKDVAEYQALVAQAGLYGVMPFDLRLKGHPQLLGYIQDDEPDLPHQVSDAEIAPAANLRINRGTPLWKILDGVTHTWSVLDPLDGAQLTVRLAAPVTVERLTIWLTVAPDLAVAKDVEFEADDKPLARATLESKRGGQHVPLAAPATFRELKLIVRSTHPGKNAWGSIGELEGFDSAGRNVLLAPPRNEPRATPAAVQAEYRRIKAADPERPVFMTVTGNFHPHFDKWTAEQRSALYPAYFRAADVIGYDIYPIYGWNKPEWIHLVHEAMDLLAQQTDRRPLYAWIETSKGGQWTGDLARQKDVTPTHIRAEVWMSICRGATGIGYFTHVWKPSYDQFGVPAENRAALREINQQITRLAPAILSPEPAPAATIAADNDVKLDVLARRLGDSVYLFAVNFDERSIPATATIGLPGLTAQTEIEALDEARTIRAEAGRFRDDFAPLAVHLYRVRM